MFVVQKDQTWLSEHESLGIRDKNQFLYKKSFDHRDNENTKYVNRNKNTQYTYTIWQCVKRLCGAAIKTPFGSPNILCYMGDHNHEANPVDSKEELSGNKFPEMPKKAVNEGQNHQPLNQEKVNEELACFICEANFPTIEGLNEHVSLVHEEQHEGIEASHPCPALTRESKKF